MAKLQTYVRAKSKRYNARVTQEARVNKSEQNTTVYKSVQNKSVREASADSIAR